MAEKLKDSYMPYFKPLECSRCHHTIRSCMFENVEDKETKICESCYRDHHFREDRYLKVYKHCVLDSSLTREDSQRICRCSSVTHIEPDGAARKLFPVDIDDAHRGNTGAKVIKCGLLNLGKDIAEAKYYGMLSKHEKHINLSDQRRLDERRREEEMERRSRIRGPSVAHQSSLVNSSQRIAAAGTSAALEEEIADDDVPFFMRKFTNRYPFGNVHMALRVGPLIIENGVEQ